MDYKAYFILLFFAILVSACVHDIPNATTYNTGLPNGGYSELLPQNNKPIMDKHDRKKLNHTLEYKKSETTVKWTNKDSGVSYEATPHRAYSNNGNPCRKVDIITIMVSNNIETEITACRNKKGQWILQ